MIIRVITPADDVVAITALLHRAYAPLAARGLNYTATYQSVEVTAQRLFSGHPLAVECEGRIVGTLTIYAPNPDATAAFYRDPQTFGMGQFAVDPEFKGKGIGRALHQAAVVHAKGQGARFLGLDTAAPAEELIATYTRWGYTIVGRASWSGKRYESVLMRLDLRDLPSHLPTRIS